MKEFIFDGIIIIDLIILLLFIIKLFVEYI